MIELKNVSYSYGSDTLLEGVDLDLSAGSFHFLTGPSGAGKTTLLKLCYLELAPSRGEVTVFGRASARLGRDGIAKLRRRVGVVHQDCRFIDHLPLSENVTLPLAAAGLPVEEYGEELDQLLHWVGLRGRSDALPPELSGGERQRAALARALIMSPDVILADEPTGNLDWEMSLRLLTLLVELNRMGKAILIATHDLNLIRQAKAQLAARVVRIRGGRVEMAGADL
ncbi:cell division ATP-binding protein FtsE [Profundibacterium mesophilum]|uniref:Cell division ATP-binding protein n=1 Tax=Profundibacterium mesophilum KAUST100406-0324 TaxID=1037889 RepID=A0A921NVV1_9RHOB|nr:ATP-binding cassette domain-containing protein [Profundibacterium mesophilum]KAF0676435.1 Cell division ATP-binding protein [Profundibacterium mesophilum KAUST100406-0324]